MTDTAPAFEGWAILELMGHRRLAGHVSEATIAGTTFLRLDVPAPTGDATVATQYYAPLAVYAITPTSEDVARRVAALAQPAPVHRWELPPPAAAGDDQERSGDREDDGGPW